MKRHQLLFDCLILFLGLLLLKPQNASAQSFPWKNGEQLTYEIHWGFLVAAEATFTAVSDTDHWFFDMHLQSRGVVQTLHPIDSKFYSLQNRSPWKSLHFKVNRNENGKQKQQTGLINYQKNEGFFEDHLDGRKKTFSLPDQLLDDLVSSSYAVRLHDWENTKTKTITVYERYKIKKATAKRIGIEDKQIGDWPKQKYYRIEIQELKQKEEGEEGKERKEDSSKKSKKKKLKTTVWITKDKHRIPYYARLKFKYGTFEITLTQKKHLKDQSNYLLAHQKITANFPPKSKK